MLIFAGVSLYIMIDVERFRQRVERSARESKQKDDK